MARREAPLDPARGPPSTETARHKKRPRVPRPRLTTLARQRRRNGSAESPSCQQNVNNMRAILSVSDKAGLATLGRELAALGIELVSTGGTAKALEAAGLTVVNVSDVTGFPEMMDGRVKTLHPAIHAGILARRHRPDDLAALASHGLTAVDLVVVNLYPFAAAAQNPDLAFPALVEEIDIGGPSLLRAAAKNFQDVLVIVDPADYPRVVEELGRDGGPSLAFRFELMQKAFAHTAGYDATIAEEFEHAAVE